MLLKQNPCFNITDVGQKNFGDIIALKKGQADCISLKAFSSQYEESLIKQLKKAPKSTSIQVLDGFNDLYFSEKFKNEILPKKGSLIDFKPFSDLDVLRFFEIFDQEFNDSLSFRKFNNEKVLQPLIKGDLQLIDHENK